MKKFFSSLIATWNTVEEKAKAFPVATSLCVGLVVNIATASITPSNTSISSYTVELSEKYDIEICNNCIFH